MKVSVLSTGSELTTGQTLNRNSSWISARLKTIGVDVGMHLTVPDDRKKILESIQFCAAQSDLVFITGGLGPTTDDFTRNLVAEWTKSELVFDENSWNKISTFLKERGIEPRENQKQQCYFPKNATVLNNSAGTANGFICELFHQFSEQEKRKIMFVVLPGPPREIEAIWKDHLTTWLTQKTKHLDASITQSWDTLGTPESEVDEIVWLALKDLKEDFPMEVGFREHLPYVEVKLTYPKSVEFTALAYVEKVTQALKHTTVLRNGEKVDQLFANMVSKTSFAFYDFATEGHFHQSISPALLKTSDWMWKQSNESMDSDFFSDEENFIALLPIDEKSCQLLADFNGEKLFKTLEAPTRFKANSERKYKYFSELALIEFIRKFKF